jgi:hypothetical protein
MPVAKRIMARPMDQISRKIQSVMLVFSTPIVN